MTFKELLGFFENYYGEKYTGIFLDVMTDYLNGYPENYYKVVATVLVKRFSRIYNKVPDPAVIEKNIDEINSMLLKTNYIDEPQKKRATPEEAKIFHEQLMSIMRTGTGAAAKPFNDFIKQEIITQ